MTTLYTYRCIICNKHYQTNTPASASTLRICIRCEKQARLRQKEEDEL